MNEMIHGGCFDKIISGHTLWTFAWVHNTWDNAIIPRWIKAVYLATNGFCLVITRAHYTIDIIMAYVVIVFLSIHGKKASGPNHKHS
jgi:hypothetical protein